MIKSFRHKGLRRLFASGDAGGINPQFVGKLNRQLAFLDQIASPEEMDLPGYRLHQLKGERRGQWAITVSANCRLVFKFGDGEVLDVDLVDYY